MTQRFTLEGFQKTQDIHLIDRKTFTCFYLRNLLTYACVHIDRAANIFSPARTECCIDQLHLSPWIIFSERFFKSSPRRIHYSSVPNHNARTWPATPTMTSYSYDACANNGHINSLLIPRILHSLHHHERVSLCQLNLHLPQPLVDRSHGFASLDSISLIARITTVRSTAGKPIARSGQTIWLLVASLIRYGDYCCNPCDMAYIDPGEQEEMCNCFWD